MTPIRQRLVEIGQILAVVIVGSVLFVAVLAGVVALGAWWFA